MIKQWKSAPVNGKWMPKAAIALLVMIGIPAIWIGPSEFKYAFPSRSRCGKVISTYAAAIEAAAQSLSPEARDGLPPSEFAKKCGTCSASQREGIRGNWMVSMDLPGRCGQSVEVVLSVMTCGGASSIEGSMPSSPESNICTTCTDLRMLPEPQCQNP